MLLFFSSDKHPLFCWICHRKKEEEEKKRKEKKIGIEKRLAKLILTAELQPQMTQLTAIRVHDPGLLQSGIGHAICGASMMNLMCTDQLIIISKSMTILFVEPDCSS